MPISQIFLSDDEDQKLSPFLRHATSTVQGAFTDQEHTIYNKNHFVSSLLITMILTFCGLTILCAPILTKLTLGDSAF